MIVLPALTLPIFGWFVGLLRGLGILLLRVLDVDFGILGMIFGALLLSSNRHVPFAMPLWVGRDALCLPRIVAA